MAHDDTIKSTPIHELPAAVGDRLGFLFAKLHLEILRMGEEAEAIERAGLTGRHYGFLSLIIDEGPLSQQALGARMGVDRTTVVALVDELEGAGFVERRRDPKDRRAYALEATDRGRAWHKRAHRAVLEIERQLLAPLSEKEQQQLVEMLQRVLVG